MIDEQSSASGHDYASDRSAIGAAWPTLGLGYTHTWPIWGVPDFLTPKGTHNQLSYNTIYPALQAIPISFTLYINHFTDCYSRKEEIRYCTGDDDTAVWYNNTCFNSSYLSQWDYLAPCNKTDDNNGSCVENTEREIFDNLTKQRVSASEEYFK